MERLLTRRLVGSLGSFDGGGAPFLSVYLGVDRQSTGRQQLVAQFKDLAGKSSERIMEGRSSRERSLIKKDIERCGAFLENMRKVDVSGLALFSCRGKEFFEALGVPVGFSPHVIVSGRPAVAPLMAALDEFKRIAVCVVDRRETKLYEYFMGRMEEVKAFSDDVPGRVRVGGWSGYDEHRIERHKAGREFEHMKNVGEVLFEEFRLRGFDWLFLGARRGMREDIERVLHTYVRDRLKGHIDVEIATPLHEVQGKTRELAERLKAEEKHLMAEKLAGTVEAGGLAVAGLKGTLEALNQAAVGTLAVRRGLSRKGVFCERCGQLGIRREECAVCGEDMSQMENVIEVAEEVAASLGAQIQRIGGESRLDDFEGIGAFLRFAVSGQRL